MAVVKEDGLQAVAVNNIGGGNIQGAGQGPQGEPGVYLKKKHKLIKGMTRRKVKGFREFTGANGKGS